MLRALSSMCFLLMCGLSFAGEGGRPPIHLWFEPEWFEGVKGSFAYWPSGSNMDPDPGEMVE